MNSIYELCPYHQNEKYAVETCKFCDGHGEILIELEDHNWRDCSIEDCIECQSLIDYGIIWYCDICHQAGNADPYTLDEGKTQICGGCFQDACGADNP